MGSVAFVVISSAAALVASEHTASAVSLELQLRPGFGSAGGNSPVAFETASGVRVVGPDPGPIFRGTGSPYGAGFVGQGSIGFRFGQFVSTGLNFGFRNSSASSPDPAFTDLKRSGWNGGLYVKGYVPFVPFVEPSFGLGVEYMADTQTYRQGNTNPGFDVKLDHHGVAVPITLGVDYKVLPFLAVGPSFQYSLVFPAGACSLASANGVAGQKNCADQDARNRYTVGKGYGVWSIGLSIRLTVPPI